MNQRFWLVFVFSALCLYLLVTRSPVSNSNSDPELTLVVSQAILEQGTIYLDAYQDRLALSRDFAGYRASNTILEQNGHYLNYFPVGPSLIAVPFVAAARWLGYDMTRYKDNDGLQNVLSGLTLVLVFGLLWGLARCYLGEGESLGLALLFGLGTGITSTLGTAFWTHNLSLPIFLLVLWLLARHEAGYSPTLHPYLIGGLIFLAYICRASAAAFILPLFLYLLLRIGRPDRFPKPVRSVLLAHPPLLDLLKVGFTSALGLGIYFLWWRLATGQWFPVYFSVSRFQVERSEPLMALAGLLISPGRGLFVYSPFFLLILAFTLWLIPVLKPYRLLGLLGLWLGLHLLIVVRAASWWGGASYGPRLLVDLLPAWFLLAVWGWQKGAARLRPRTQSALLVLAVPLVAWSLYLNSYQGLFNPYLSQWEIELQNEQKLQAFFDWRYPPFRASPDLFCQRDADLLAQWLSGPAPSLGTYEWGQEMRPQQGINLSLSPTPGIPRPATNSMPHTLYLPLLNQPTGLVLVGWSPVSGGFSWSKCPQATVYLPLGAVDRAQTYRLLWEGATIGPQTITLRVNDVRVETFTWDVHSDQPEERAWLIPGSSLQSDQFNAITFDLPTARPASEIDNRPLALAFFALRLEIVATTRPQEPLPPSAYP
jgi:hypothetical protein